MPKITILSFLLFSVVALAQGNFNKQKSLDFQKYLNEEYADASTSPLEPKDLEDFKSLDFYPVNESFFVTAKFIRTKKEKAFKMKTSTSRTPLYVKYGEVHFVLNGKNFMLNLYRDIELSRNQKYKNDLFLPFSDLTSGDETYIGGRYIDLKIPAGDTIDIDFNTAYNPYCAYSHKFSCPRVPLENDLQVKIEAGVKNFHD
ncbi:DUF1684 domain-containing protein [Flavobacterium algicola]|uniref:DUF1684 domain-containing protein n=1 Tax=Flavobacterium algicola TaxID=556529 RepID=UPI001EFCF0CB|nr:DUF1684 domain-containing protein [Flavobacterium algicola]MCG9793426.1 DUF1684 domain-containing protein [Flavobacterium algicola]